ncbi:hypothetical protein SeMB42_g07126 [Synchytrium endobioticum]|uniref:F-box domain-containing protein n=1 Tax=Synchytrium endobioticum TaxID=286115 RepID=A0A507CM69_9FUNG|nr:hypothetical protein SeMB42_g07126 [Synchytrium endobioticum]TPX39645.1 hypothetical protein SeLEV6574_g07077 [Synchytrium endobioticum]
MDLPVELWMGIAVYLPPSVFYGRLPRISRAFRRMIDHQPLHANVEIILTDKEPDVVLSKFEIEVADHFVRLDKRLPPIGVNVYAYTPFSTIQPPDYLLLYNVIFREFTSITSAKSLVRPIVSTITATNVKREVDVLRLRAAVIAYTTQAAAHNPDHSPPVTLRATRWSDRPWYDLDHYLPTRHDASVVPNLKTLELDLRLRSRSNAVFHLEPSRFDGLSMLWPFEELRIGTRVSFTSSTRFKPDPNVEKAAKCLAASPADEHPAITDQGIGDDQDANWVDEDEAPSHHTLREARVSEADEDGWETASASTVNHNDWSENDVDSDQENEFDQHDDDDSIEYSDDDSDEEGDLDVDKSVDRNAEIIGKRRQALFNPMALIQQFDIPGAALFKTLEINFPLCRAECVFTLLLPCMPTLRHVHFPFGVYYQRAEGTTSAFAPLPPLESLGYIQNPGDAFFEDCLMPSLKDLAIQIQSVELETVLKAMVDGLERPANHIRHLRLQFDALLETCAHDDGRPPLDQKVVQLLRSCIDRCKGLDRFTLEIPHAWFDDCMRASGGMVLQDLKRDLKGRSISFEIVKLARPVHVTAS